MPGIDKIDTAARIRVVTTPRGAIRVVKPVAVKPHVLRDLRAVVTYEMWGI